MHSLKYKIKVIPIIIIMWDTEYVFFFFIVFHQIPGFPRSGY